MSRIAGMAAVDRLIATLERLDARSDRVLPVLTYHRIDLSETRPELDPRLISASPAEFLRQMEYLAGHRHALSLDDLLAVARGERALPRRPVVVTFDDAYRDFSRHAWPVLRRHGIPATMFVPTAYPADPQAAFWWDHLHAAITRTAVRSPIRTPAGQFPMAADGDRRSALAALQAWVEGASHGEALALIRALAAHLDVPAPARTVLDWPELRDLARHGLSLAPHTHTHPLLNRIPLGEAQDEVTTSRAVLERELGMAPPAFAFPGGARTPELVSWLPTAGFEVAFTTERGANRMSAPDWLSLRRINVGRRSSVSVIRAQMLSWSARRTPSAAVAA